MLRLVVCCTLITAVASPSNAQPASSAPVQPDHRHDGEPPFPSAEAQSWQKQPQPVPGQYTPAPPAQPDIPAGSSLPPQNTPLPPSATPMETNPPSQTPASAQPATPVGTNPMPAPSFPLESYPSTRPASMPQPPVSPLSPSELVSTSPSSRLRSNETFWGLRFTPLLSASYTLEEFVDDESYRKGSQDFNFSYAIGAFGDYHINRYFAVGGDVDLLFLNPKVHISRHDIKMLSAGPAIRLSVPVQDFELFFRMVGAFSVAFLPDDLTERTMVFTNGTTASGKYKSQALGYSVKLGPGLMYQTEHVGFFLALAFQFSNVYTKLLWADGSKDDMNVSPQLFGVDMGVTFVP
jgi:hypothetical protein